MRRPFAVLVGVSLLLAAGPALAAEPVLAKLQASVQGAAKPVAGGAVFECLGDVCAARAPSADTNGVRACKELARQVGQVSTFGPASHPLAADQIAACNESARR